MSGYYWQQVQAMHERDAAIRERLAQHPPEISKPGKLYHARVMLTETESKQVQARMFFVALHSWGPGPSVALSIYGEAYETPSGRKGHRYFCFDWHTGAGLGWADTRREAINRAVFRLEKHGREEYTKRTAALVEQLGGNVN